MQQQQQQQKLQQSRTPSHQLHGHRPHNICVVVATVLLAIAFSLLNLML
jgi:hypothetical protein